MIKILYVFTLALIVNIDSFFTGVTYSIKDITVPKNSRLIISILNILISYISVFFASYLKEFLSESFTSIIGGSILIFIGMIVLIKTFFFSKESNKYYLEDTDYNNSKNIEFSETLLIVIALSIDNIFINISTVFSCDKIVFLILPIVIGIIQYISLLLGTITGKNIKNILGKYLSEKNLNILSGIIFILLGFIRII